MATYSFDYELKRQMDDNYKTAQPLQQQWWQQADIDTKMAVGQQDYYQLSTLNYRNQGQLQFNKILRVINMIGGYQRKNRHVSLCVPIENSDNETADQISAVMFWSMGHDDTYEKISHAFDGALITGMNMLNVWMDFRDDPENGDIRTTRVPYNAFIMDPYWKDPTLSDCDWIWQRRYMTSKQILAIYPRIKKELPAMKKGQIGQDGRFLYMAENRQMYNQDLYAYDEYWTREYRTVKKILDRATGEVIDWPSDLTEEKFEIFKQFNPNVSIIKVKKATVKLQVLINNNLVYEELAPYGIDNYPYVPFLCYFNPEVTDYSYRYMGVVRNIRDSQVELNRRRNKMLDILDSQINSGMVVKEDALVDPEDAFLSGQGRVLYLKDSATMADIQQLPPPQIPPSMFELQKILDDEIMNISGVNEELFGSSDDKSISGFLTQLRMGAGLVSLQSIFDRLNMSQKTLGKLWIQLIQANFGYGKVRRILNKKPTEQFKNQSFQRYDCVVEEGILTSTQRQMQFVQLLQLREMGLPVPTELLLKSSTLQNKQELIDAISQEEQSAAMYNQAQQQLALEQQAIMSRSLEAQAQNNFAAAEERQTRAVSNVGLAKERQAQAANDRAKAALDNAKALKELDALDESRLMKLAAFIMDLQQRQQALQSQDTTDTEYRAKEIAQNVEQVQEATAVPEQSLTAAE